MAEPVSEEYPTEIHEFLVGFEESLKSADGTLQSLMSVPRTELLQKLGPLEQAKLDLASAYALNSMFWIYLITQGINPKEHAVKQELHFLKVEVATELEVGVEFWRVYIKLRDFEIALVDLNDPAPYRVWEIYGPEERIRTYMNKVKEITDRQKASRLDKGVASRIVRHALWDAKPEGRSKMPSKSSHR